MATRRNGLQAAAVVTAVTAAWRLVMPLEPPPRCCDAGEYLRLAVEPGYASPTPYSYRRLVPLVVHWLPGSAPAAFAALTYVCLIGAAVLVYLLCRELGADHGSALFAVLALVCSRGWTYYLYNPFLSDPAAFLLLAGCFLALVRGRRWAVVLLLAALAGTREIFAGVVAPLYTWLRERRADPSALRAAVSTALPAALVYGAMVRWAPSSGLRGFGRVSLSIAGAVWRNRVAHGLPFWLAGAFGLSLGVWWLLAAASWCDPAIRRLRWWLLPVFLQFLLGGDWARFALYAFPVIIPAGALTLTRNPSASALRWLVALQLPVPLLDVLARRPDLNHPGPSLLAELGLMAAGAGVLTVQVAARHAKTPLPSGRDAQEVRPAEE